MLHESTIASCFAYCPECGAQNLLLLTLSTPCKSCGAALRSAGSGLPWAELTPAGREPWRIRSIDEGALAQCTSFYLYGRDDLQDTDESVLVSMRKALAGNPALGALEGLYQVYRQRDGASPFEAYERVLKPRLAIADERRGKEK